MGTDPEPTMKNKADQQLVEIDKKYSGFIHVGGVWVNFTGQGMQYAGLLTLNYSPFFHR